MTHVQTISSTPVLSPIPGIHHVTAITADAQKNVDFYARILGLRFVKVTVNYDDPGTYHLYYGDGLGRPGTLMTHFVWPGARVGRVGVGQVSETAFAIPVGAAKFWMDRLTANGVKRVDAGLRFGSSVVTFVDGDDMPLALVESGSLAAVHYWREGKVAAEVAIHGFHGVTLLEADGDAPAGILTERFGYRESGREGGRIRYAASSDAVARSLDVVVDQGGQRARMGAGQVHHVAFRTATDETQRTWLEALRGDGHLVSPIMNRDYFRSIYFREPGGVLFEIATDGPGMTFNETAEELGTHVMLPTGLEGHRAEIMAALPPLTLARRIESG